MITPFGDKIRPGNSPLSTITDVRANPSPNTALSTVYKTESYASRFFNSISTNISWGWSQSKSAVSWACEKTGLIASLGTLRIFIGTLVNYSDIKANYVTDLQKLRELTDDNSLGNVITDFSSLFINRCKKNLLQNGVLKSYIEGESAFSCELVQSLVTKCAVNVGALVKAENKPVNFVTILTHIADVIKKEMSAVEEEILQAETIENIHDREAKLKEIMEPVVDAVLSCVFPNGAEELPIKTSLLRGLLWSRLRCEILNELPKHFIPLYREYLVPTLVLESYKEKLKDFLPANGPEKVNFAAAQVEGICGILAQKITSMIEERIIDELREKPLQDPIGINIHLQDHVWIKDPLIQNYVKDVVESLLMQAVVHHLKRLEAEGTPINEATVSDILGKIPAAIHDHLFEGADAVLKASKMKSKEQQKQMLREFFKPLSDKLIELIHLPTVTDSTTLPLAIPFSSYLGKYWNGLRDDMLPDLLAEMYLDTTSWTREVDASKEEIRQRTGTNYIPEACSVLAQWARDFIPVFIHNDCESLVDEMYKGVHDFFKTTNTSDKVNVDEYFKENEEKLKTMFTDNISKWFSSDDALSIHKNLPIQQYMEAVFIKSCNGFTKKIEEADKNNDFLVNLNIKLLEDITNHFEVLNQTAEENKSSILHNGLHQKFIEKFGSNLHRGVPKSPEALQARQDIKQALAELTRERKRIAKLTDPVKIQKCEERIISAQHDLVKAKNIEDADRIKYFRELTNTFLEVCGITDFDNLPFPSPIKAESWKLVSQEILPRILKKIYQQLLDPQMRSKMLISALGSLNEALEAVDESYFDENNPATEVKDEKQKELNKVCGGLILEMVKLIPKSMIKAVLKIDKIKVLSAEMLGQAVRKHIGKGVTLMGIFDNCIKSGLPHFHPGSWEGSWKQLKFVGEPSEDINFKFPETPIEIEARARAELKETELAEKKAKEMIITTARLAVSASIQNTFKLPFKKLLEIWNFVVDKVFGTFSKDLSKLFQRFGKNLVMRFISTSIDLISIFFSSIFWVFTDMYLKYKLNHLTVGVQLDIQENLFYTLTDTFLNALKGNLHVEAFKEDLLNKAKLHDEEEKIKAEQYAQWIRLTPQK